MTDVPPIRWLWGPREQRVLARRYWINDTAKGVLNTAVHNALKLLPTDRCSAFGAAMSRYSPRRFKKSDARARKSWMQLRPEASDPASVDAAMKRYWECIGRTMAEFSVLDRLWDEGRISVEGAEHVIARITDKKPVLMTLLHLGNWELIGVTGCALGHKSPGIYLVPRNRFEHRIAIRARERFYTRLVPAQHISGLAAARELRANRLFGIFIDDFVHGRVSAPSFGRPLKLAGNIAHAVRLAEITGAAVVPAYCVRLGDSARFKVTFLPPMDLIDTGDTPADRMANVAKLDALIEPIVRAHLDQWYYLRELDLAV